jgi:hypothetical protein
MKRMITIVALLILTFAWLAFAGGMKLTWKPFSLKFEHIFDAIGWILVIAGMACFRYEAHKKGYTEGTNETIEKIEKGINSMIEKQRREEENGKAN